MNITIRTFLKDSKLWEQINLIEPFPFITPELDYIFIIEYGSLPLFTPIYQDSVESVAKYLVQTFGEKWRKISQLADLDIGAGSIEVQEIEHTALVEGAVDNEAIDKVSAYDSDLLVDDSGKTGTETNTQETDALTKITKRGSSVENAFNNLPKLDQLNIIKVAMADAANFLKTDVY